MKIANEHIEKLRSHGLFVSEPRISTAVFANGVRVGKPATVAGNHIPDYTTGYADLEKGTKVEFDAPLLWMFGQGGTWIVTGEQQGRPSDFQDQWNTQEEAVNDILDFFFGDPTRMQAKAELWADFLHQLQAREQT
jgi:hypothetical protein